MPPLMLLMPLLMNAADADADAVHYDADALFIMMQMLLISFFAEAVLRLMLILNVDVGMYYDCFYADVCANAVVYMLILSDNWCWRRALILIWILMHRTLPAFMTLPCE